MSNYYLQEARAAVPGLAGIMAAHAAVQDELKRPHRADWQPHPEVMAQAKEALRFGTEVAPDLGARLLAAERGQAEMDARRGALRQFSEEFQYEWDQAEQGNADLMLSALKPYLAALLDETERALSLMGAARTAEAVIEGGPVALGAWADLLSTAANYTDLRSTQWAITRSAWTHYEPSRPFTNKDVGVHLGLCTIEALWNPNGNTPPPWPTEGHNPRAFPKSDREFLLWAVEHREHVWLPTVTECVEESHRFIEVTNRTPMALEPSVIRKQDNARNLQRANGGAGLPR
ncbi:hypothetical protein [Umezawaea sp. Da 62-37]|uniref:hypothetical protein n=1 Tax=Umezawaea sp. Da 62-37 TaxID=3075927 RepID=UPI0028F702FA|nr:hypothetical protein [Umezawaea sp. Da 62-37]WNV89025.1 hypothetical protein RM788_12200 [Umezawaea sp. Da 62-37]